jgi:hypothetical protein
MLRSLVETRRRSTPRLSALHHPFPRLISGREAPLPRLCLVLAGDFAVTLPEKATSRPSDPNQSPATFSPRWQAHNCGYHRNPGGASIWAMVHELPTRDPEQGPDAPLQALGRVPSETAVLLLKPEDGPASIAWLTAPAHVGSGRRG